jgi:RNA polymerase sigma-70 factor (ECF subfamily)
VKDWELVQIARARRDPADFAPLYEAYAELVWRFALSRLGDRERAADATSQTFAKAIAALPAYRPERRGEGTTFRSWLMTIARNVVIDEARGNHPTTQLDDPGAQARLADREQSPEEHAIASVERQRIERALRHLPATQRQIVELRAIGMKGHEIANLLNMSVGAVKTANHRAYLRLRELLSEPDGGEEVTR